MGRGNVAKIDKSPNKELLISILRGKGNRTFEELSKFIEENLGEKISATTLWYYFRKYMSPEDKLPIELLAKRVNAAKVLYAQYSQYEQAIKDARERVDTDLELERKLRKTLPVQNANISALLASMRELNEFMFRLGLWEDHSRQRIECQHSGKIETTPTDELVKKMLDPFMLIKLKEDFKRTNELMRKKQLAANSTVEISNHLAENTA
ncbi:hypothetical protein HYV85_02825 [Candidatus Woesearchaeota archaeon]|nr:hypothetical protein [Candidatus Woesearchaeota archaeon]